MIDATDYYQKDKEPYGKCPECGSRDISVYLLADYNSI
jgi:ssDNA-binding Zn-finger/Zn-ribbon topoisomerase 1